MSPGNTPAPPPEVEAVIAVWMPHSVQDADPAVLAAVMPVARSLVAAVCPATPMAARRLLWALAPMGVWAHQTIGSFTNLAVNPRNVETWVTSINRRKPQGWRNAARAALRQVGRVVNPQKWPEQPDEVGRPPACAAYHPAEEAEFIQAVGLPGADEPVLSLAVAGFSCGAGMRGPEIVAAEIGDLRPVGSGRLVRCPQTFARVSFLWCFMLLVGVVGPGGGLSRLGFGRVRGVARRAGRGLGRWRCASAGRRAADGSTLCGWGAGSC